MKSSILRMALFLGAVSLMMASCSKDSDVDLADQLGGTYELYIDNELVAKGSSEEVGILGNAVSIYNEEDLGILLTGVPLTVGGVLDIDNSNITMSISGKNILLNDSSPEMYFASSGSIERTSKTKVSFEGQCSSLLGASHSFKGEIESEAFKMIKSK